MPPSFLPSRSNGAAHSPEDRPRRMEVGLLGLSIPPRERVLKAVANAEALGYDAMWWPDHLMGMHPRAIWTEDVTPLARYVPNPDVFLDTVACIAIAGLATERMRLGASVTEAVRRHPAMLANEWLTLDHLSRGRAILGIGAGEAENIRPYGLVHDRPVARLAEALSVIKLLWSSNEAVDFDGEFWRLDHAVLGLTPYREGRPPPIWIGGQGPRMLDLVGRLGDGWMPAHLLADEYAHKAAAVRASAIAAGRDPASITYGLGTSMVLAETREKAQQLLANRAVKAPLLFLQAAAFERHGHRHPLGDQGSGLLNYIPSRLSRAKVLAAVDAISPDVAEAYIWHGTPDDIVAHALDFVPGGLQHLQLGNLTHLADLKLGMASEALLDDVRTQLQAIATRTPEPAQP
jgi:phthiodiolone/phenolphthiodiolone dimycocerosates ketoreductase